MLATGTGTWGRTVLLIQFVGLVLAFIFGFIEATALLDENYIVFLRRHRLGLAVEHAVDAGGGRHSDQGEAALRLAALRPGAVSVLAASCGPRRDSLRRGGRCNRIKLLSGALVPFRLRRLLGQRQPTGHTNS